MARLVEMRVVRAPTSRTTHARPLSLVSVLRHVRTESLYRNSFLLVLNYAIVGAIGFVFWAAAARLFPASEIGNVAALFSGVSFVGIAAGLGLQSTIVRYLAAEPDQRSFLVGASAIVGLAAAAIMTLVLLIPGHLGLPLLSEAGVPGAVMVLALAVLLTVGAVADAAIIGFRVTGTIVVKNALAGLVRIALLPLAAGSAETGLVACLLVSVATASAVALGMGLRRAKRPASGRIRPLATMEGKLHFSAGNHVASLVSVGPLFVLPIYVVNVLGPAPGAYLAAAVNLLIALSAVPTTVSQSLFAELAARPAERATLVGSAFRTTYAFMVPLVAVTCLVAWWLLRAFGEEYTAAATCLRLMALGSVVGAFNYIADVVLNSAGRIGAFLVVNVSGAFSVLGLAMFFGRTGLTGIGAGWLIGQIVYAIVATTALIRTGTMPLTFRRRPRRRVP